MRRQPTQRDESPRSWTSCLFALWVVVLPLVSRADSPGNSFDSANKLFEQGKYPEAGAAYHKLITENQISSAIYFNLGNAYFKWGQTGQAIVAYRLAQQLDPRDPDIRANLRFARENVGGSVSFPRRWERWLTFLTINELTLATTGAVWLWLVLLALSELRRDWVRILWPYKIISGISAGMAVLWLGFVLETRLLESAAVVIHKDAVVRYGPFEEAQSFYTLRDGAEVTILNHKESWLHVTDGSNRTGWLESKHVFVMPPG